MADDFVIIAEEQDPISVTVSGESEVSVVNTELLDVPVVVWEGGPVADFTIGGKGFDIDNLQQGDLLGFNGQHWHNRPDEDVTDGGNF